MLSPLSTLTRLIEWKYLLVTDLHLKLDSYELLLYNKLRYQPTEVIPTLRTL